MKTDLKRREGIAKLTGSESYVDDLELDEEILWAATVRSPVARGRIERIRYGSDVDWSNFTIVDHRDIPGANVVKLIEDDQPVLAVEHVQHRYEPIALIAHPSRTELRRGLAAIEVETSPLPPVFDVTVTPTSEQVQFGPDNVMKRICIEKGECSKELLSAPYVVEGWYHTGAQEHVYLEPQGMLAREENGVLIVSGSMQCPYYVQEALTHALDREDHQVRVIQTSTGGGFGGKEEFPSGLAIQVALLALKSGKPVKLIYDRDEDMKVTTKRHPSWVHHRTGVDVDGRLIAQQVEVILDAGAYVTLSPVVLSRGVIHAAGPYSCEHVSIDGRAMLSNTIPCGAFRGFGAPQTLFAVERHMDVIARELGLDPVELRRRNLLREGQKTATGQVIRDGGDRLAILDRALELSDYHARQEKHRAVNARGGALVRGIGLATFYHGAGFTGGGEAYLSSVVEVAGLPDGGVEVLAASTEIGQGTETIFTQLAAARMGLSPDRVRVARPDTHRVPNSGPTVASRTAMIVGKLVERACDDLRSTLGLSDDHTGASVVDAIRQWFVDHEAGDSQLVGSARYQAPPGIVWDEERYRGDAYGSFGWGTYVAEVEVDRRTYAAKVVDFVAVQDIGTVLNEVLARGQVQGGVVQGIGWALLEECVWREGGMVNSQLTNYIIPTADDVPPIRVAFVENPYPFGAQGAKGLGELPMDGPAPAILNAVAAALEVDPRQVPLTPEKLMELVDEAS